MHIMALRYGDDIIVIVLRNDVPGGRSTGRYLVTPDLTYLRENAEDNFRALILTHGHEDHIWGGAIFLQYSCASGTARGFRAGAGGTAPGRVPTFPKRWISTPSCCRGWRSARSREQFIHVTHSIVSAVALAITTPVGVVIHTGDFKVDPTPTAEPTVRPAHAGRLRQPWSAPACRTRPKSPIESHTPSLNALCARVWRTSSTVPSAASSSPASVLRFTASSRSWSIDQFGAEGGHRGCSMTSVPRSLTRLAC